MTFPAEIAERIRADVLTAWYLAGSAPIDVCPCQYGPCGYCRGGRHGQCTHREHPPIASPETYIVNRSGYVATGLGVSTAAVWVGRPCVWSCPCGCRTAEPADVDPAAFPVQLDLFA